MGEFEKCIKEGKLVKVDASADMVRREIESAEYDLRTAEESLGKDDHKWASVQAYYSMFHSAKALVLDSGYREKSHYCLLIALRKLYVDSGELERELADDFEACMDIRHEANYGLSSKTESAGLAIDAARRMIDKAKRILHAKL